MTPPVHSDSLRRQAWCELVFDQARSAGEVRLRVSGCSMLPAMWPGDVVTVRRLCIDEFLPGQIVLFRQKEKLTIHRVRRVAHSHLVASGDSLPCCDPPVSAEQVIGRVVSIERKGHPIDLEQSLQQLVVASLLRCSGRLRRLIMILGGNQPLIQLRAIGKAWFPWAS